MDAASLGKAFDTGIKTLIIGCLLVGAVVGVSVMVVILALL